MIELSIGILLTGVIMSAAFSLYLTQHKQLLVQDEISDMQSSVRVTAAELTTNLRLAGMGLPPGITPIQSFDTNPDTIIIAFANGELEGIHLETDMPYANATLDCSGQDLSPVQINDQLYIANASTGSGEYFTVEGINYVSGTIQPYNPGLSQAYAAGSIIVKPIHYRYYIDQTDTQHPKLMRQQNSSTAQIFAEEITDLQFRYIMSDGQIVEVPFWQDMIREIMLSVSARTSQPDPDFPNQYRIRTLNSRVKVRNIGLN